MTNFSSERPGEFELIAKLFAPLAAKAPGAFGLTDDAATFRPPTGEELVMTADLLSADTHFRAKDPPELIAKKALRVNLSDLAAKGAMPRGYLLSLALPRDWTASWMAAFARGLADDQSAFSISLFGGDTTATDGPLTIAITAFGTLPEGTMIRRNGARPGDLVFVSGTVGDAGAGLAILLGTLAQGPAAEQAAVIGRYHLPTPRMALGQALRGIASAALDVSDGLLADLEHIADTSAVRIVLRAKEVPLSPAYRRLVGGEDKALVGALTAGDDYEIAFTAAPSLRNAVLQAAARTGTSISEIGRVEDGSGVAVLDSNGREIPVSRKGFRHF